MPTLGEACQTLRIGRVTLAKWIKRLGIETTRHEWDYRYEVIAPEDVERIAEARKKLPSRASGVTGAFIPTVSTLAFDRRPARDETANDASLRVSPMRRQRPLQRDASTPLPDGMMSRTDCADLHTFPRSTLRRWCDDGRIETSSATYGGEHGTFAIAQPVTTRGLAQFYTLAHGRADFTRCPSCPHSAEDEAQIAE